eukprot:8508440-Lingulodinium_polyedra.AAC.1
MLRLSRRRGPRRPAILAVTERPATNAQATLIAQRGMPQPSNTCCDHSCPMRSKTCPGPRT